MALYYSNGGPGPATKLWRVDAPDGATIEQWRRAPAFAWQPETGWQPRDHVQLDILDSGDFGMIDESAVESVQNEMRAQASAPLWFRQ